MLDVKNILYVHIRKGNRSIEIVVHRRKVVYFFEIDTNKGQYIIDINNENKYRPIFGSVVEKVAINCTPGNRIILK